MTAVGDTIGTKAKCHQCLTPKSRIVVAKILHTHTPDGRDVTSTFGRCVTCDLWRNVLEVDGAVPEPHDDNVEVVRPHRAPLVQPSARRARLAASRPTQLTLNGGA